MPQLHLLCWDDEPRLSGRLSRLERQPDNGVLRRFHTQFWAPSQLPPGGVA